MNKTLLFLSLFLLPYVVFAQGIVKVTDNDTWNVLDTATYKCVYNYQFQPDSLDKERKENASMLLLLGEKQSLFTSYSKYYIDSLIYLESLGLIGSEQVSLGFSAVKHNGPKYQISQHTKNSIRALYATTEGAWEVEDTPNLKWELGDQTDSLAGFQCRSAFAYFRGRHYEAWYTTDFPISKGPYKFGGLPGLIVRISDRQQTHIFELQSITETNSLIVQENKKTIKMNLEQLRRAQQNDQLKMIEKVEKWFAHDPEKVARIKKQIRNQNNPIELIDD